MDQVQNGLRRRERPSDLVTKPVECDEFAPAELAGNLHEHGADQRHLAVDRGTAEGIPRERERQEQI